MITLRYVSEELTIISIPLEAVEGVTLQPVIALQAQRVTHLRLIIFVSFL